MDARGGRLGGLPRLPGMSTPVEKPKKKKKKKRSITFATPSSLEQVREIERVNAEEQRRLFYTRDDIEKFMTEAEEEERQRYAAQYGYALGPGAGADPEPFLVSSSDDDGD